MSSTLRFAMRPDRAVFSSSVGPTVITNAAMANTDFTLAAGTYTFTVVSVPDGVTLWTQTGCVIADAHVYAMPNIGSRDSGASAGVVALVV